MHKMLMASAMVLALGCGAALSQQSGDTGSDPSGTNGSGNNAGASSDNGGSGDTTALDRPSILDDNTKMGSFYTDQDMKTMKSGTEFSSSFSAMNAEDQAAVKAACQSPSAKYADFCKSVNSM